MNPPLPTEKRMQILRDWDETRDCKPVVYKTQIAQKHGVCVDTVKETIRNREAYEKRAKFEGVAHEQTSPSLANDSKRKEPNISTGHTVLAIPDLHAPFQHRDALEFLKAVRSRYKVTKTICLGDEIDAHAYSKWPKDPDGMGPGQELKAAIEQLIPFYVDFPEMEVCISNHTIRPAKMMQSMGIPRAFWPQYTTMLNAPDGWSWHEYIIIDGVRYIHGDQGKGGQNGWTKNSEVYHQSTVVGHWHSKAGVYYDSSMFNLNAGCLIDASCYAFNYAKNSHKKPNLGCGLVMSGKEAHFIPMHTDSHGRWTGKLHG